MARGAGDALTSAATDRSETTRRSNSDRTKYTATCPASMYAPNPTSVSTNRIGSTAMNRYATISRLRRRQVIFRSPMRSRRSAIQAPRTYAANATNGLEAAVRPRDQEDQIERERHREGFLHLPGPLPQRLDRKIHTRDLAISGVSDAASGSGFSGSRK